MMKKTPTITSYCAKSEGCTHLGIEDAIELRTGGDIMNTLVRDNIIRKVFEYNEFFKEEKPIDIAPK